MLCILLIKKIFLHLYKCKNIITLIYNNVNGLLHLFGSKNNKEILYKMNKEIETAVGNNIRLLREKKKLTQEQVAAKLQINGCDITRSAVAKIEVGQRHLYPDEIILLKQILNVEYDEIFEIDIPADP